jgi:hypothetical protein
MERVKRLIEITPSQLKLYEAIGRDFPDLSPAQTARIVAIVREADEAIGDDAKREKLNSKTRTTRSYSGL